MFDSIVTTLASMSLEAVLIDVAVLAALVALVVVLLEDSKKSFSNRVPKPSFNHLALIDHAVDWKLRRMAQAGVKSLPDRACFQGRLFNRNTGVIVVFHPLNGQRGSLLLVSPDGTLLEVTDTEPVDNAVAHYLRGTRTILTPCWDHSRPRFQPTEKAIEDANTAPVEEDSPKELSPREKRILELTARMSRHTSGSSIITEEEEAQMLLGENLIA